MAVLLTTMYGVYYGAASYNVITIYLLNEWMDESRLTAKSSQSALDLYVSVNTSLLECIYETISSFFVVVKINAIIF